MAIGLRSQTPAMMICLCEGMLLSVLSCLFGMRHLRSSEVTWLSILARSCQRSDSMLLRLISWNVLLFSRSVFCRFVSCLATLNAHLKLWMTPSGGSFGNRPRAFSRLRLSSVWVHAAMFAARFPGLLLGSSISGVVTRGERPMPAWASAFLSSLPDWTVGTMMILFSISCCVEVRWLTSWLSRGLSQFRNVIRGMMWMLSYFLISSIMDFTFGVYGFRNVL